jgi:hypothetical protein
VDVTIVNTLSGGGSKSAVSDKQGKYTELCKQNNMDFLALAFESSGKMHDDVVDFVKSFVKPDAENRGFDPDRSTRFWISQISMAIQRLSSQMIITRSCQINGRFQNPVVTKEITAALENFDMVDGRTRKNSSNGRNNRPWKKKPMAQQQNRNSSIKKSNVNDQSRFSGKDRAKNNNSDFPTVQKSINQSYLAALSTQKSNATFDLSYRSTHCNSALKQGNSNNSSSKQGNSKFKNQRKSDSTTMSDESPKSADTNKSSQRTVSSMSHESLKSAATNRSSHQTVTESLKSEATNRSSHRTVSLIQLSNKNKRTMELTSSSPPELSLAISHSSGKNSHRNSVKLIKFTGGKLDTGRNLLITFNPSKVPSFQSESRSNSSVLSSATSTTRLTGKSHSTKIISTLLDDRPSPTSTITTKSDVIEEPRKDRRLKNKFFGIEKTNK